MEALLEVQSLSCSKASGERIFSEISFQLHSGDILVITGKSGAGKSTLLKCLCHLSVYEGRILFHGQSPKEFDIPKYRTRVLYVPQRPSILPSTPRVFLETVSSFGSRRQVPHGPISLAGSWGIKEDVWDRPWSSLSGGEAQRVALAVAVGIGGAEILLLDEPTSALDGETSQKVEEDLVSMVNSGRVKGIIWITHSEEQSRRVGNRWVGLGPAGLTPSEVPLG